MRGNAPRFIGMYQSGALQDARSASLPLFYRVYLAAQGYAYSDGHAPFASGELWDAVTPANPASGEMRAPNPSQLGAAIRRAKLEGLVHESSTSRCLVLPHHRAARQTGRSGGSRCRVSGHG